MSFKIGDRVRILPHAVGAIKLKRGDEGVIVTESSITHGEEGHVWGVKFDDGAIYGAYDREMELVAATKPRPHADLIKAWADGAEIERLGPHGWTITAYPTFLKGKEYRIKPESKPDAVSYLDIEADKMSFRSQPTYANLKLIFDGETGKLKEAHVL